jgi:hypothetical protein
MTSIEVRRRIMSQMTEDVTGLWELPATQGAPGIDELIAVLSELIGEELVTVYSGTKFDSEERPLPVSTALAAIRDSRFWEWAAPERGPHLRAVATPAGQDWYFGHRQDGSSPARFPDRAGSKVPGPAKPARRRAGPAAE